MSVVRVRAASRFDDVREVVRLYARVWPGSLGLLDLLGSEAECLLLLDGGSAEGGSAEESPVGYAFVEPDPVRGFAELQDIAIDPELRGRGLGRRLLAEVMERYPAIKLVADSTRPELLRFYAAAGFHTETVFENYYSIGHDGVRMSWRRP